MTKTENYNLNQWAAEDPIRRTDFNEDNAKLDSALHELEQGKAQAADLLSLQTVVSGKAQAADLTALQKTVAGKADVSTVTALQNTVAGKANTSALNALQTQVTAVQSVAESKGNCTIKTGTYVGTGVQYATVSIITGFQPKLVFVADYLGIMTMVRGVTGALSLSPSVFNKISVTWLDNGVSWQAYNSNVSIADMFNTANTTYYYVALG